MSTRKSLDDDPVVTDFLAKLEAIPWFANTGQPIPETLSAKQIPSWDAWPGPEYSFGADFGHRWQDLFDQLMRCSEAAPTLWQRIETTVLRVAGAAVPYDSGEDAWYAPNAAVWEATFAAGLIGLCLYARRPIPQEVQEQWKWFASGHWLCGWTGGFPSGTPLVY